MNRIPGRLGATARSRCSGSGCRSTAPVAGRDRGGRAGPARRPCGSAPTPTATRAVVATSFLGAAVRVTVRLADGTEVKADLPAHEAAELAAGCRGERVAAGRPVLVAERTVLISPAERGTREPTPAPGRPVRHGRHARRHRGAVVGGGGAGGRHGPLTEADQPEVLGRPVEHTAAWLAAITGTPRRGRSPRPCTGSSRTASAPASCPAPAPSRCSTPWPARASPRLWSPRPPGPSPTPCSTRSAPIASRSPSPPTTPPHTKPAPDPYLAACRALGVDPAVCVAVEDTETGVASAEAAGCAVLAVPSLAPIEAAPGRTVLASLEGVTVDRLRSLLPYRLRVMTWNLWYGGTKVRDHRAKQLKVIAETDVDVVGLQETYGGAAEELAEALGWHHHSAGPNLGIISRLPITAVLGDPDVGFYGAAGARIAVGDQEVEVWTAHLDAEHYGPYESEPLAHEEVRTGQMRDTLRRISDAAPVVLVGDFNSPSHLDRPDVAWPVTKAAEEAGFADSFRRGPSRCRTGPGPHLVAGARAPGAAGPDRLRPPPRPAGSPLPDVRQRHPADLAGRRGQRLAVRPRRGDHHIFAGQRARDCLTSVP